MWMVVRKRKQIPDKKKNILKYIDKVFVLGISDGHIKGPEVHIL